MWGSVHYLERDSCMFHCAGVGQRNEGVTAHYSRVGARSVNVCVDLASLLLFHTLLVLSSEGVPLQSQEGSLVVHTEVEPQARVVDVRATVNNASMLAQSA